MSERATPVRRIGIMQGRLGPPEAGRFQSFPRTRWQAEFAAAAAAKLDAIEWIYDQFGADVNPIASDPGIAQMQALSQRCGVAVVSVCADYFMDRPIVHATDDALADLVARLYWLIDRCRRAGVRRMVIPFVDASRIATAEHEERVLALLREMLPLAERACVELHLETAFGPADFARFLEKLPHPMLKVNYDAGNSASLGYAPTEELSAYGERIGSVHIPSRWEPETPTCRRCSPALSAWAIGAITCCKRHAVSPAMRRSSQPVTRHSCANRSSAPRL